MDGKFLFFIGAILYLTVSSEARVIVSRASPNNRVFEDEEIPFSMNPLNKDKKSGLNPGIWDSPTEEDDFNIYEYDARVNDPRAPPSDYDYNKPGKDINKVDNKKPGTKPERFPLDGDRDEKPVEKPKEKDEDVDKKYDSDKSDDEVFDKPFYGEDFDKSDNDEKDLGSSSDEDKPIHKDADESDADDTDEKASEDDDGKEHKPMDEEEPDREEEEEDEKPIPEDDDEKKEIPEEPTDDVNEVEEVPKDVDEEDIEHEDENNEDENIDKAGEAGFLGSHSIFDNPFFNVEQVKKYFSHLDRALGQVFRQTMDEALLLNGTYANTTEEEVDIDGKKYIVTKSIIKGADNHSSIYVEALSSKPKLNYTEGMKDIEMKNLTQT